MANDPRKTVRVIAYASKNTPTLKTVNVVSVRAARDQPVIPERLQVAGAVAGQPAAYPTLMDSGGSVKGLPTIFISGYAGPS